MDDELKMVTGSESEDLRDIQITAALSQLTAQENDLIVFYKQLSVEYPEFKEVFDGIVEDLLKHVGKIQGIMESDGEVKDLLEEGRDEASKQVEIFVDNQYTDDMDSYESDVFLEPSGEETAIQLLDSDNIQY